MAVGASLLSLAFLVAPALAAAPTPRAPRPASPSPAASSGATLEASPTLPAARTTPVPTIIFLIDNSASLPPLDPEEKRVEALEKMFTFLKGRPYRLILFGGRRELFGWAQGTVRAGGEGPGGVGVGEPPGPGGELGGFGGLVFIASRSGHKHGDGRIRDRGQFVDGVYCLARLTMRNAVGKVGDEIRSLPRGQLGHEQKADRDNNRQR